MDGKPFKADYDRDGVVRVRQLLSAERLRELRDQVDRFAREIAPGTAPGEVVYEADGTTVRNMFHLDKHDGWFAEFAMQPAFIELVAPLVNGDVVMWGTETFNKPAKVGSEVPWHQDNAYFCQKPSDILSLWIALDPATRENGAVQYLPGTHHGLRPHSPSGIKGNSYGLTDKPGPEASDDIFHGTLDPGDALIHHGQIFHRSDPNVSDHSRLSLVIVYRGAHTVTDEALRAEYLKAMESAFAK